MRNKVERLIGTAVAISILALIFGGISLYYSYENHRVSMIILDQFIINSNQ